MEKLAKRSCKTSPKSHEVIEANKNYQQSSDQINCDSITAINSQKEDSNSSSNYSFLSSDLMEDASSSSSSSSSSNGPLFQLSDLMAHLPIKRGLSKYYQGKSQSFTSLASVERLEDLPKREKPYKKRMKLCKNSCGGLDGGKLFSPKATISKKASQRASFSPNMSCNSNNLMVSCRLPHVHVQKNF